MRHAVAHSDHRGWLALSADPAEFQSTIDRRMAIRMMDYAARVWMGLGKDQLGPDGEYPFVLPIVIYNGEQRWNAATDIRNLLAPVPDELLGHLPSHRYLLIDIQALDPSRLPSNNVLAMIARFEQAPTVEELELLAAPLADWLGRIGEQELVDTFGAWITLVLTQRFGSTGRELELKLRNEEDQKMTTLIERARKWGEERDQRWLQRGRVEGERELVHRLAIRRFGSGITAQLLPLLSELREPEPIATVADAIIECQTADEFLARVTEVGGLGTG